MDEIHLQLEGKWKQKPGSMKKPVDTLLKAGYSPREIEDIAEGCALYSLAHEVNFIVAVNLYASIEGNKKQ